MGRIQSYCNQVALVASVVAEVEWRIRHKYFRALLHLLHIHE